MYPEYAEIKGKKYKIDTRYTTALKCFEVIDDKTITDFERALAIVYLLFDMIPEEDFDIFLEKATIFLECGEKERKELKKKKKDFDFKKDFKYIVASFMSDYKTNLSKEDLHFWFFIELIAGLKDDCILNKIRDIRNCDPSKITDKELKNKVIEAKEFYDLEEKVATKEQQKSADEFYKNLII